MTAEGGQLACRAASWRVVARSLGEQAPGTKAAEWFKVIVVWVVLVVGLALALILN